MTRLRQRLQGRQQFQTVFPTPIPQTAFVDALLQHYQFPTCFIDLTSSVKVAAHFAVHGNTGGPARILVYAVDELGDSAAIVDLAKISWAIRPCRQSAYMVFVGKDGDLGKKHTKELQFNVSNSDIKAFCQSRQYVGNPEKDPASGLLNILAGYNEDNIEHDARQWLDRRIPWAAMPTRIVTSDPAGRPVIVAALDQFHKSWGKGFSGSL